MLLKPLFTIPCFTLGKTLLCHLIFEHSAPQKFIFSLLHHLDGGWNQILLYLYQQHCMNNAA